MLRLALCAGTLDMAVGTLMHDVGTGQVRGGTKFGSLETSPRSSADSIDSISEPLLLWFERFLVWEC